MINLIQGSNSKDLNTRTRHSSNSDFILNDQNCEGQPLKNGNIEALERIYIEYFDILCLYGRQFSEKDPFLVQDCIQDLFIHLYVKKNNLSNIPSTKFYLMKSLRRLILYKKAINKHKNLSLEINNSPQLIEYYTIEKQIFTTEKDEIQKIIIKNYILQLPKRQREAIYLRFYAALRFSEIAEKMNLQTKSVYKIIYKGVENLRVMYETRNSDVFFTVEILPCLVCSFYSLT